MRPPRYLIAMSSPFMSVSSSAAFATEAGAPSSEIGFRQSSHRSICYRPRNFWAYRCVSANSWGHRLSKCTYPTFWGYLTHSDYLTILGPKGRRIPPAYPHFKTDLQSLASIQRMISSSFGSGIEATRSCPCLLFARRSTASRWSQTSGTAAGSRSETCPTCWASGLWICRQSWQCACSGAERWLCDAFLIDTFLTDLIIIVWILKIKANKYIEITYCIIDV